MKNEDLLASGLYGTWTFATDAMTDLGYYKGTSYLVMHFMPDPLQPVRSCDGNNGKDDNHDDAAAADDDGNNNNNYNNNLNNNCSEVRNHACSYDTQTGEKTCINTETSTVEWSDVVAYIQFGIHFRYGIAFKEYANVDTSDWLGPYNIIMAPSRVPVTTTEQRQRRTQTHKNDPNPELAASANDDDDDDPVDRNIIRTVRTTLVSRYVETPSTASTLRRPQNCTIAPSSLFDAMVGLSSVRHTIRHTQRHVSYDGTDLYRQYLGNCDHGDVQPSLPQLELTIDQVTTHRPSDRAVLNRTLLLSRLRVEYNILNLPDPTNDSLLYRLWPTMQKHLGNPNFPITGPYCFGGDPHRGHAIHLSYDSANITRNQTWRVVKDHCLDGVPCWDDGSGSNGGSNGGSGRIPYDDGTSGWHKIDLDSSAMLFCYLVTFLLVISLVCNCQLSNQLKRLQLSTRRGHGGPTTSSPPPPAPPSTAFGGTTMTTTTIDSDVGGLDEPLLPQDDAVEEVQEGLQQQDALK